jgi:hypothetical protein
MYCAAHDNGTVIVTMATSAQADPRYKLLAKAYPYMARYQTVN